MNNPDHFRKLRNQFFGLKYLKIWCGSGMENIRIRDKHPGSATLLFSYLGLSLLQRVVDPTEIVEDLDPDSEPTRIFSNVFNINFTFVFPSWKCVRLHITTRYKLFREFFLKKRNLYFLNWKILRRNCRFKFITDPELTNNFGSDRIRILVQYGENLREPCTFRYSIGTVRTEYVTPQQQSFEDKRLRNSGKQPK